MFWYEGHMGELFFSEKELPDKELYCEVCGESDWPMGQADTFADAWDEIFRGWSGINIMGSGGYSLRYIFPLLCEAYNITPERKLVIDDTGDITNLDDFEILEEINKIIDKTNHIYKISYQQEGQDGKLQELTEYHIAYTEDLAKEEFFGTVWEPHNARFEEIV